MDAQKAIIIKGARQVGKTTLIRALLQDKDRVLWVNGDNPTDRLRWGNASLANLKLYVADHDYIVFDEAQRIENIGLSAKMILDARMGKQLILSGSSSLNLSSTINEPLTGRKWSFELFPFSWGELVQTYQLLPMLDRLDSLLIYGSYPEVLLSNTYRERRLEELTSSYLYKDILEVGQVKKPDFLVKLLKALAFQVGAEVSYNELANMLQIDKQTVQKYISLLEDSYVLFRLSPLSTNPRKEISTSRKVYFYDNGIRNALIGNLKPLNERNDIGLLWENFIVSEWVKQRAYRNDRSELYFWRAKYGAKIDLVRQQAGATTAYEIKYNPNKKARFSGAFLERYQPEALHTVNRDNFFQYL